MRAAILREYSKPLELEQVSVQEPQEGEVLVRIAASGICGSDVHAWHGHSNSTRKLPLIPGHEGAGVVEAVGRNVSELKRGDHVVVAMAAPCGTCEYCSSNRHQFCHGRSADSMYGAMDDGTYRFSQGSETIYSFVGVGSLAEYALVPSNKVVKIKEHAPFESMCITACGVTTGLGAAFNVAQITPGSSVLVFGCGGVGLSIVQGARIAGAAKIIAVDNNPKKLALASNMGASHCLHITNDAEELEAALRAIRPKGVDYAFDAVGMDPERIGRLMALTDMGGLTVAVGVLPWNTEVGGVTAKMLLLDSRRLTGVRGGNGRPSRDLPRIFELYHSKRLKLDELVGASYAFEDIAAAFSAAEQADHGRVVVRVTPSLL